MLLPLPDDSGSYLFSLMNPFLRNLAEWLLLLLTTKNADQQNPCLAKGPAGRWYQFMVPLSVRGHDAKNILGKADSLLRGMWSGKAFLKKSH